MPALVESLEDLHRRGHAVDENAAIFAFDNLGRLTLDVGQMPGDDRPQVGLGAGQLGPVTEDEEDSASHPRECDRTGREKHLSRVAPKNWRVKRPQRRKETGCLRCGQKLQTLSAMTRKV